MAIELTAKRSRTLDRATAAVNAIDTRFFDAVDPASLVDALEALVPAPPPAPAPSAP